MMATAMEISWIDQVGETAGAVWHQLDEHGPISLTRLIKEVDAPRDQVMAAVGWLAREGKIRVEEEARTRMLHLVD